MLFRSAEKYGIISIGIFGSVARGEQHEESDLDVFVELKDQSPHKVEVFLLVDKGFLLFSFHALTAAFDWVLILAHQDNALCKKCFFRGVTFSAVKQTVLAIIIFDIFGNTR